MIEARDSDGPETVEQQRARLVVAINEAHDEAERDGVMTSDEFGQRLDERGARRQAAREQLDAASR